MSPSEKNAFVFMTNTSSKCFLLDYRANYFHSAHSVHELNLPSSKAGRIHKLMKESATNPGAIQNTMFDEIQAIIYMQMALQSFIRYRLLVSQRKVMHRIL